MRRALASAAVLMAAAGAVAAHDFWIIPEVFDVAEQSTFSVVGQTSVRFPTSVSAVTPERVEAARLVSATSEQTITNLAVRGTSLLLTEKAGDAGQYVVGVALKPRAARETPAAFRRYVALEGNTALAEQLERDRLPAGDSMTRRTAKYAKTFIEVGRRGARAFSRSLGYPAEFVPLNDPSQLHVGSEIALRLEAFGKPVPNAHVHAGWSESMTPDTTVKHQDLSLHTDSKGVVRIPLRQAGLWNVRTIHAAPSAPGSGADWDVSFTTIVFRVTGH